MDSDCIIIQLKVAEENRWSPSCYAFWAITQVTGGTTTAHIIIMELQIQLVLSDCLLMTAAGTASKFTSYDFEKAI